MAQQIRRIRILTAANSFSELFQEQFDALAKQYHLAWTTTCVIPHGDLMLNWDRAQPVDLLVLGGSVGLTDQVAEFLRGLSNPVLRCHWTGAMSSGPTLWFDDAAIGREAARHLWEHGWRRGLAFLPSYLDAGSYRLIREESFLGEFHRLGGEAIRVELAEAEGTRQMAAALHRHLGCTDEPLAVFCFQDKQACWMLTFLEGLGYAVPTQVGIISCEDTEVARTSRPPLSSVRTSWRLLARAAAQATLGFFSSGGVWPLLPSVPPVGVATRRSTSRLAMDDPFLDRGLMLIRRRLPKGMSAADLARKLGVSVATLHRRFVAGMAKSPGQVIRELRLEAVRMLLVERPEMSVQAIARRSGWVGSAHLARDFRRAFGTTPARFRSDCELGSAPSSALGTRNRPESTRDVELV